MNNKLNKLNDCRQSKTIVNPTQASVAPYPERQLFDIHTEGEHNLKEALYLQKVVPVVNTEFVERTFN